MKPGILTPAQLGVLLGSALQINQVLLWPLGFYMAFLPIGLLLFGVLAIFKIVDGGRFLLLLLAFSALAFGFTGMRASAFISQSLAPELEGRNLAVSGVVASLPQPDEVGLRFRFDVEAAQLDGHDVRLPKRLELAWYRGVFARGDGAGELAGELQRVPAALLAGQRWQFTVRLKAPHGAINPHGFDYELWQWEQGVQATGYVRAGPKDPAPTNLGMSWRYPIASARGHLRERIYSHVTDPGAAGLIAALVVGDQGAIERADWDVFRATGVAHLMSISGLHVTMFAWGAALLVGWLWRRSSWLCLRVSAPGAALLGGMVLALGYALFSGWGVPAQRTVWMLATVGGLRLLGVRWPWPQVWLLACAVVVLADPWALLQAGFWLSFVAVGVLFATDSEMFKNSKAKAQGRLLAIFREQGVITLALTPLTLLLFGQVSLVGLLANALAIPWVTLLVTPLAMLGTLWPVLWGLAAGAIDALGWFLAWLAAWPWATVSTAQAPLWAGSAGVLGGVLLTMRWPVYWRLMGVPLLLPLLFWQVPQPVTGQFELLAVDIGQGNAVLLRTASHSLLFDAGPRFSSESDAGNRVLVPLLRALDVPLDMLVLSHSDSDHTGGAQSVLTMQPRATLLSSIESEHPLQALHSATRCSAGQHWQWDSVSFEVLHPLASDYDGRHKTNHMSCTLRISNGTRTVLLAGDIEQAQEAQLVASGADLRADVLLVPHHGSKTSSSAAFLDAVQPRFALVQAGYRNRFGHPASPVLVRYSERHVKVVYTPRCGAATWQSWQPDVVRCEREEQQRYWHHRVP